MTLTLISEDEINTEVEIAQSGNTKIELLSGNCIEILKTLPDESIDCCITSPPYFGLRNYGSRNYIWGGDEKCEHVWENNKIITNRSGGFSEKQYSNSGAWNPNGITSDYSFCQLCGAWLGSLGLEPTPELYVEHLVMIFREVRRTLKKTGTLWLNIGDSYNGSGGEHKHDKGQSGLTNNRDKVGWVAGRNLANLKPKDLIGIPWMTAFALRADGWWLRQDIIWAKGCSGVYSGGSVMPESVTDRFTKSHEYLFLLSKSAKYYFDQESVRETITNPNRKNFQSGGRTNGINNDRNDNDLAIRTKDVIYTKRNRRSVWTINPEPTKEAHFATFPTALIVPCIKAGCPKNGTVLDPFLGSGTTAMVSRQLGRNCIGIELNPEYLKIAKRRINNF